MSCLSCKTNRYLTNIYKSQQRVTLPQPLPIPTAQHEPRPARPDFCIVRRESNSNENCGGSSSSWVSRKAARDLAGKASACANLQDTWRMDMERGTVQWGLRTPSGTGREPNTARALTQQACDSANQMGRCSHRTWPSARPAPQGSPERLLLPVSKSLQLIAVSNCLRLFSWCSLTADSVF